MRKKIISVICMITALVMSAVSPVRAEAGSAGATPGSEPVFSVEKIGFNNQDFIKGMDVSSVLSLEASGVRFSDADGNERDIFEILAENGVNYIRVRVWNSPYDGSGNGYGGGNCDVTKAAEIGRRAAEYGMKLNVDFHYSDFWADPGKQQAPAAWSAMTLEEKEDAVYSFTLSSLDEIRSAGADIGMVQIGNETTSGVAGVYDWSEMPRIFAAGARAVRAFDPDVLVALHFTEPQNSAAMRWFADTLNEYDVDYDVFGTSYYPFWHGSLENLTSVLGDVAETYGKYVMVMETSYPYTLTDSDGHPNTVAQGSNDSSADLLWDFSVQGQANELRDVMAAVNSVPGGKGLGVFYWEGAWITVGDTTGLSGSALDDRVAANRRIWESCGSGWAASYAGAYEPDDAGRWYGGSAVDNQAMFDSSGRALLSLGVFGMVDSGYPIILGDVDGDGEVTILDATAIQRYLVNLPNASFNKAAADTDGDSEITILDATAIQRFLVNLIDHFPAGGEPSSEVTVRFTDKNSWGAVNAYLYDYATGEALAEWPGVEMTAAGTDGKGYPILSVRADLTKYNRVIFNNGTLQTSPTPITKAGCEFTQAGKNGKRYVAGLHPYAQSKGKIRTVMMDYPDGYQKKIYIWTPEGYDPEDTGTKYSTLYMTDGHNVMDRMYSYAGVEWQTDETVTALMQSGCEGVIIVGIDGSNPERTTELTPDLSELDPRMLEALEAQGIEMIEFRADVFADFVVNDLIPYIESNYNVNDVRGFAGSSCGGQAAFYIGMEYPQTFRYIGAFSSAFSYFTEEAWDEYLGTKDFSGDVPRLYLYTGTNDTDSTETWIWPTAVKMAGWLLDHGYPADKLFNVVNEYGMHHERYWALYFPEMLCWGLGMN